MKITSSTSTRLALVMGLAIASSILSTVAKAESIPQVNSHGNVSNKPFITNAARRDTLHNLNQRPLNIILETDGGKTKESSDKGKDSSDKGKDSKETCESGNCGGALIDRINPVILPADQLKIPVLQNVRPQTLIKVNKPIF
ncbi:hypothetical protein [Nostoc sp. ChiSLP03a]|uniref:hypothetical protein n=1 Tax=Nostoc sp. ChiSLP03a TaxID=3075380 RepID=UPI002AD2B654|nr:hypothetical protein [Nostoc sp. ChiSLP03a]MDZ8212641.1 hypothetical protein [Nostoc sp. ChiSLP03a]